MTSVESTPISKTPNPMYMLAFDHRQVLRDLYPGVDDAGLAELKMVVMEALDILSQRGLPKASLAFLVDEEYGAAAAIAARQQGFYVALPVEASRTPILRPQFPDYRERFDRIDPQCLKTLVFYNPSDDKERKRVQLGLLQEFGEVAREQGRDYLLEVLITPTPEQLARGGGHLAGFRATLFPDLMIESIAEMQQAGIEPDVWKIEGFETVDATAAVGAQATADGRDGVRCIVLGSGETQQTVNRWLSNASAVPTFSGLAIGRTVWREPLAEMLADRASRDAAVHTMATTFAELIDVFGRESAAVDMDA